MNNVQFYRKQVKLSQKALAEMAGCSQPTICEVEAGGQTTVEKAQKIVGALSRKGARSGKGRRITFDDVFPPGRPTTGEAA